MTELKRLDIRQEADIVTARHVGRDLSRELGFGLADQTRLATSISEMVRNVIEYAGTGMIAFEEITRGGRRGLEVVVQDNGPGIEDIELAMSEGYSSAPHSLGLGLPAAKRLVHEFEIKSRPGAGTTVIIRMWQR